LSMGWRCTSITVCGSWCTISGFTVFISIFKPRRAELALQGRSLRWGYGSIRGVRRKALRARLSSRCYGTRHSTWRVGRKLRLRWYRQLLLISPLRHCRSVDIFRVGPRTLLMMDLDWRGNCSSIDRGPATRRCVAGRRSSRVLLEVIIIRKSIMIVGWIARRASGISTSYFMVNVVVVRWVVCNLCGGARCVSCGGTAIGGGRRIGIRRSDSSDRRCGPRRRHRSTTKPRQISVRRSTCSSPPDEAVDLRFPFTHLLLIATLQGEKFEIIIAFPPYGKSILGSDARPCRGSDTILPNPLEKRHTDGVPGWRGDCLCDITQEYATFEKERRVFSLVWR
jgi:hypothetical protein